MMATLPRVSRRVSEQAESGALSHSRGLSRNQRLIDLRRLVDGWISSVAPRASIRVLPRRFFSSSLAWAMGSDGVVGVAARTAATASWVARSGASGAGAAGVGAGLAEG